MDDVKKGEYRLVKTISLECPGMPFIINSNDQIEYMKAHKTNTKARPLLCVMGPGEISFELKFIPEKKTKEFALEIIKKWGKEYAEKVLSATKTGSLYFHIIHHFGSYEKFMSKHCKSDLETTEKRKRSDDKESSKDSQESKKRKQEAT